MRMSYLILTFNLSLPTPHSRTLKTGTLHIIYMKFCPLPCRFYTPYSCSRWGVAEAKWMTTFSCYCLSMSRIWIWPFLSRTFTRGAMHISFFVYVRGLAYCKLGNEWTDLEKGNLSPYATFRLLREDITGTAPQCTLTLLDCFALLHSFVKKPHMRRRHDSHICIVQ